MGNGLPSKAKVGTPGKLVTIDPATYFLGKRMEAAGTLQRGQALMLAVTLPRTTKATKGRKK